MPNAGFSFLILIFDNFYSLINLVLLSHYFEKYQLFKRKFHCFCCNITRRKCTFLLICQTFEWWQGNCLITGLGNRYCKINNQFAIYPLHISLVLIPHEAYRYSNGTKDFMNEQEILIQIMSKIVLKYLSIFSVNIQKGGKDEGFQITQDILSALYWFWFA